MDRPGDPFAAFIQALADALAESPDVGDASAANDALARRLHVSRHHLSRVVVAAAGEPPARLRRRILLERAAYRLASSDLSILDIAVEAGYSSHEAFTRAFIRGYGDPPARWRRRPGSMRLPAPNGVHFHPPASLLLPARTRVTSMDLTVRMVQHHVWLLDQMLARAVTLGADTLDRPIELSVQGVDAQPTLRSLLSRLVGQLDMWTAALDGREYDFAVERGEAVDHMRRRLAAVGPAFVSTVVEYGAQGRFEEALVCPGEPVEVYSVGAMVAHVLTFAAFRRTLVAGALADAGFDDLDGGDPIRWVAQPA